MGFLGGVIFGPRIFWVLFEGLRDFFLGGGGGLIFAPYFALSAGYPPGVESV